MAPVTHRDRIKALIEDHLEERVPRAT
jgi:hypothetical protein